MTVNTRPTDNFVWPYLSSAATLCSAFQVVRGSYSQVHFNVEVRTNPLALAQSKVLGLEDFLNVHPLIKKLFLKKEISNVPPAWRLNFFLKNWQKVTIEPVILSYVEGYKIPLVEYHPRILFHIQYR